MASSKRLIVGLGNPGAEYEQTRHNVGFMAVDVLAEKAKITLSPDRGPALAGSGRYRGRPLSLVKPLTYMVVLFTTLNYVKLVPYALLDQISLSNLSTSLVLAPLAPVGVWLGLRLHKVVDEKWFYPICYVLLFITGVKLLYDGFTTL